MQFHECSVNVYTINFKKEQNRHTNEQKRKKILTKQKNEKNKVEIAVTRSQPPIQIVYTQT